VWYLHNLLIALLLQTPQPVSTVVVGLTDGQQILIENPEFSGFIQGRSSEALLTYRHAKFRGQMPTNVIARIEFAEYRRGQPFTLRLTLKSGQRLQVQSESRSFVTVTGKTEAGTITIKHPDPVTAAPRLRGGPPDRSKDLTIQYLEFPGSSE
jgi:hypothetical protein